MENMYGYYSSSNSYDALFARTEATEEVGSYVTPVLTDRLQVSASVTIEYVMEPVE